MTLEDEIATLSRNVGQQHPNNAAPRPSRTETGNKSVSLLQYFLDSVSLCLGTFFSFS
jgi:hypothetical protein